MKDSVQQALTAGELTQSQADSKLNRIEKQAKAIRPASPAGLAGLFVEQ